MLKDQWGFWEKKNNLVNNVIDSISRQSYSSTAGKPMRQTTGFQAPPFFYKFYVAREVRDSKAKEHKQLNDGGSCKGCTLSEVIQKGTFQKLLKGQSHIASYSKEEWVSPFKEKGKGYYR